MNHPSLRLLSLALVGSAAVLLATTSAHAATRTWNSAGATTTSWALDSNWIGGVAPVNGDDVFVTADGTFDPTNYNGVEVNSLTLTGSTTLDISGLKVGAGGVANTMASSSLFLNGTTTLLANQTWGGTRTIFVNNAVGDFKIDFNGSVVRFDANSAGWTGGLDVRTSVNMAAGFALGAITPYGTATVTMINRRSDGVTNSNPSLGLSGAATNNSIANAQSLANNITLSDPGTGNFTITQTNDTIAGKANFYILSGNITGAVNSSRSLSFTNVSNNAATTPATIVLTGTNNYAAQTVIGTNTTLQIGNGGTIGTLGSNTGNITNSGALAINRSDAVSVANVITGAGRFEQMGSGTTTLGGDNNYTGTTTVTAGTLLINGNQTNATGAVTVNANAILGGSGTIGGAVNVSANGTISPGNSAGNLILNDGLTLAGSYLWELGALSTANPGSDFDTITITAGNANITGASIVLSLGAFAPSAVPFWETDQTWTGILNNTGGGTLTGTFAAIDNTSWSSLGSFTTTYTGNDVNLQWTAVPEPTAGALVGLALAAAMLLRRRRQSS